MKKILLSFILMGLVFNCEDVIEVDLNTSEPRLVIDAGINWLKNTTGNEQSITLTLTAPFFDNEIPPATGATVTITDANNNTFTFVEDGTTGIYRTTAFVPVLDQEYSLTVLYNEEVYTATETLKSVVPIDFIEQNNEGGFLGEDIELRAFFTDPEDIENFYLFEFETDIAVVPDLNVYDDRFTDGNQFSAFFTEEDLESGDTVVIKNFGISQRFHDFMFLLLQQNSDGGGPFETQPATVRGNIINQTNQDNFALGYFSLSEVDEVIYTVE